MMGLVVIALATFETRVRISYGVLLLRSVFGLGWSRTPPDAQMLVWHPQLHTNRSSIVRPLRDGTGLYP